MPRHRLKLTHDDKTWSASVKSRDNNCCVICSSVIKINSHHIIPRENSDFRFNIKNGITLCPKHHVFSRDISAHNNSFAFFLWLAKHRPEQFSDLTKKFREYYPDGFLG